MNRLFARRIGLVLVWMLLVCALPAAAQTRAWLDRASIYSGETVALNIETDQPLSQVDFSPLRAVFEVGGQSVRRSYSLVNGRSSSTSVFSVGLRPRGDGVLIVPALHVGTARTQPLQLTVLPAPEPKAGANADVFVETEVDATQPYVQQTVGVTVRLNYAVPLASGQLELEPPADASLQRVGDDITYRRSIDGRSFQTVERRFMLIPERSGALLLPGARFNGTRAGGFFDPLSSAADDTLAAAAPVKRLQVLPIPSGAPTPWLPLHRLMLRYLQVPQQAWVGQAAVVEVEAVADGATAAQMQTIDFPAQDGVQIFADPPRTEEQFADGRPQTVVRRRFSIVSQQAGALRVQGPRVAWWDAVQHRASVAALPPLILDVAPGVGASHSVEKIQPSPEAASPRAAASAQQKAAAPKQWRELWWAAGVLVLLILGTLYAGRRKEGRSQAQAAAPHQLTLAQALQQDDLGAISMALVAALGLPEWNLEAAAALLGDAEQRRAIALLQAARWGAADPKQVLALLRQAFSKGVKLQKTKQQASSLLPPLYPK